MRGISLDNEAIRVSAEGINEMRDRTILLTRIQVHYDLTIPAGSREKVDRALSTHVEKCHIVRSLQGAVEVHWTADVREV